MKRGQLLLVTALVYAFTSGVLSWKHEEIGEKFLDRWAQPSLNRTRRSTRDGTGSCLFWSGAHIKSFDNRYASFKSECAYTLVKEDGDKFSISYKPNGDSLKLVIAIGDSKYELIAGADKTIVARKANQLITKLTEIQLDLLISYIGPMAIIKLPKKKVQIKWNKKFDVQISIPATLRTATTGLCGIFDDDHKNDWFGSDDVSHDENGLTTFLASWVDESIGGKCNTLPDTTNPCDDVNRKDDSQLNFCRKMEQEIFKPCFAKFDPQKKFIEACEWDHCVRKEAGGCQTISNFAAECRNQEISVANTWRQDDFCPFKKCSGGYEHLTCGPETHVQCSTDLKKHTVASTCVEGCFCPHNLVEHKDKCIHVSKCTCQHNAISYNPGATAKQRCHTCTCRNGKWDCPKIPCLTIAVVAGDPHYTTFDKKRYDFMGVHKYYLMKTKNMSIEAQHRPCGGHATCTKELTVRYDGYVIDLKQQLGLIINGQTVGLQQLPVKVGKIIVKQASSTMIMVELTDIYIHLIWDGVHYLEVHVPDYFTESKGLLGNNNENAADDFLTPEGDIEPSPHAFGESWRVLDQVTVTDVKSVESAINIKPFADLCQSNQKKMSNAEKKCNVLKTGIFTTCHSVVNVKSYYDECLFDVCNVKDTEKYFCSALNAYALECARNNIRLDWRRDFNICARECPLGQTSQMCGDSCSRSCKDIHLNQQCASICIEGCNCPRGTTLDNSGSCIPVVKCPCVYQSVEYPAGTKFLNKIEKNTKLCSCDSGAWNCSTATLIDRQKFVKFPDASTVCNSTQGKEYTECQHDQPRTCQDVNAVRQPQRNIFCKPGCKCKEGYIFDTISRECFKEQNCPCHHANERYKNGDTTKQGCKHCTCVRGNWNCDESDCKGTCKVYGVNHFESFDGHTFDFDGLCSYTLVQSQTSPMDSFKISFSNDICGAKGVPCSRSVTIEIGAGDSRETLYLSKGVAAKTTRRMSVTNNERYIFVDVADLKISLQWDQLNEVNIQLDQKWKGLVLGMCGNFNGKNVDDFMTPASGGMSETSAKVFGDSWRDQPCIDDLVIEDKCSKHPERKEWAREKCNVLLTAFKDCHSVVPVATNYRMCIADTCACETGDDCHCLCSAIASYAKKCNENNKPIKWRRQDLCPLECDAPGTTYSPCGSNCPVRTCDTLMLGDNVNQQLCANNGCFEGCYHKQCPPGQVLRSLKDPYCVLKSECKPFCMNINNETYYEGDIMTSDNCQTCHCSKRNKVCSVKPCPTPPVCQDGYQMKDCLYKCNRDNLCHSMKQQLVRNGKCLADSDCVPGCAKNGLSCDGRRKRFNSNNECVNVSDCTCISNDGVIVLPNTIHDEDECTKCECKNNEYNCISTCRTPAPTHTSSEASTTHEPIDSTTIPTTATPYPPMQQCSSNGLIPLLQHNLQLPEVAFTASSTLNSQNEPQDAVSEGRFWRPKQNVKLFWQVDLGSRIPIYAVRLLGDPASQQYVKTFRIIYSNDNAIYFNAADIDEKEVLHGTLEGLQPVRLVPFEARYLQIIPMTWSNNIAMNVEFFDCGATTADTLPTGFPTGPTTRPITGPTTGLTTGYPTGYPTGPTTGYPTEPTTGPTTGRTTGRTTEPTTTTESPIVCKNPMALGFSDGRLGASQINASSVLNSDFIKYGADRARLNGLSAWRPAGTKGEKIIIDFKRQGWLTGIATQGHEASDSWVQSFKLFYSTDNEKWTEVLDANQLPGFIFANYDAKTIVTTLFDKPIKARYLRIEPILFNNGIAMRIEVYGCFEQVCVMRECEPGLIAMKINRDDACPQYKCVPTLVCYIEGGDISSFDSLLSRVDLCGHVIAQQQGIWNVSGTNNCFNSSCNLQLIIKIPKIEVKINHDLSIVLNGQTYAKYEVGHLNWNHNAFRLSWVGNTMSIASEKYGFTVSLDTWENIKIEVSSSRSENIFGLCGVPNGDPSDDLTKNNQEIAKSTEDFTSSYRTLDWISSCPSPACSRIHLEEAHKICSEIPDNIIVLKDCNIKINEVTHSCIQKTCKHLQNNSKQESKCYAATDFVAKCLEKKPNNLDFSKWRLDLECPSKTCPPNEVYQECFFHKCERSCSNMKDACAAGNICHSGCFCKEGYVRKNDACVLPHECEDCVCSGISGDQLTSFENNDIMLSDQGSYTVTKASSDDGKPLCDVIIIKCACDNQPGSVCTQAVTVRHQDHEINMVWSKENIITTLDGALVSGYRKESWVSIERNVDKQVFLQLLQENVKVTFRHESRAVVISTSSHSSGRKLSGLCGVCDKSGLHTNNESIATWFTNKLPTGLSTMKCDDVTVKQCDEDLINSNPCSVLNDASIFGACHNLVDQAPFVETCRRLLCLDRQEVCTVAASYVEKCRETGHRLDWRSKNFCPPKQCPQNLEYQTRRSACPDTCERRDAKCQFAETEGCFCPPGKVLRGEECVRPEECLTCYGHYVGSTWQNSTCQRCTCTENEGTAVTNCDTEICKNITCLGGEEPISTYIDNLCCPNQACPVDLTCDTQNTTKPLCQPPQVSQTVKNGTCTYDVCGCGACEPLKITSVENLPEGMESTVNLTNCCPKEELVCKPEKCSKIDCAPPLIETVVNTTNKCCPTKRCVPPKNTCTYYAKYLPGQGVAITPSYYQLQSSWTDGCFKCQCTHQANDQVGVVCVKECPVSSLEETANYNMVAIEVKNQCCPKYERIECKEEQEIKQVGSNWTSTADPCKEYTCVRGADGVVQKKLTNPCVTSCGKGQRYAPPNAGECCGRCEDIGFCKQDDREWKIGEKWASADKCTKYSCVEHVNGQAQLKESITQCPPKEKCPMERQITTEDGCCLMCRPLRECESRTASENTVGIFTDKGGFCRNTFAVGEFTECSGTCVSNTRYIDGKDESDCKCCQVETYKDISVMLQCNDSTTYAKAFKVPKTCKCTKCENTGYEPVKDIPAA